ncbi:hypothetical protein BaRGS_00020936 [Batillaria attramentaria]|uniref:BTB domain-containing protein n=1 Tax=Batillaria attramentaria TaxID=370345 RepID=A0ABD0KLT8_9CAEN
MMAAPAFQDKVFANLCQGIDHLYTDQQLCDLKVVVGEQTFECHRLVLAAVSQFFQALLTSSWRESSSGIVNIEHEDVPAESFSLLLDILYHGKDIITMETAKDILKMSIFLQVKFLEDYCEQYLSDNMAPDTCLGVWLFADRYQLTTLAKKASHMAVTQCTDVPKSKEVVQLSKGTLLIFLSSQKQLSMDGVCETILRWVEGDIESRKDHLGELLPFVSFPHLTQEYLSTLMAYMHHPLKDTVFGKFMLMCAVAIYATSLMYPRSELESCFPLRNSNVTRCIPESIDVWWWWLVPFLLSIEFNAPVPG